MIISPNRLSFKDSSSQYLLAFKATPEFTTAGDSEEAIVFTGIRHEQVVLPPAASL